MDNQEIHINYFYRKFQVETQKLILKKELTTISEKPNETDIEDLVYFAYINSQIAKETRIGIYNEVLYKICEEYTVLAGSNIDIYPANVFEFVDLILNNMEDNKYKESFIYSLQFIYSEYLGYLGKGNPLLRTCESDTNESYLEIMLNHNYQILHFEAVSFDKIEQDKIINKMVMMECNNELGPFPNVVIRVRKDI